MTIKILYDHQIFNYQTYGGISKYYTNLINCFSKDKEIQVEIALQITNNKNIPGPARQDWLPDHRVTRYLLEKYNRRFVYKLLRQGAYDIFHPTYYNPYFLKCIKNKPYVITVYDMIHELQLPNFPRNRKILDWKKRTISSADKIIAISEHTRQDLIRLLKVDPEKVVTVHLGYSPSALTAAIPLPKIIPPKYVLYVGDRHWHKNFKNFICAMQPLLCADKDLFVVCAGGPALNAQEQSICQNLRVIQVPITDKLLNLLYANAQAFVYPSLYEGFGLPILEAFANSCPVAASNSSCFPEIADNAAIYFDPNKPLEITNAIKAIIYDNTMGNTLRKLGKKRLSLFTWQSTAQKTKRIYKDLIA